MSVQQCTSLRRGTRVHQPWWLTCSPLPDACSRKLLCRKSGHVASSGQGSSAEWPCLPAPSCPCVITVRAAEAVILEGKANKLKMMEGKEKQPGSCTTLIQLWNPWDCGAGGRCSLTPGTGQIPGAPGPALHHVSFLSCDRSRPLQEWGRRDACPDPPAASSSALPNTHAACCPAGPVPATSHTGSAALPLKPPLRASSCLEGSLGASASTSQLPLASPLHSLWPRLPAFSRVVISQSF